MNEGLTGEQQTQEPQAQTTTATMTGDAGQGQQQEGQTQQQTQQQATYDFSQLVPEGMEFSQEENDKFVNVIKDMNLSSEQANSIVKYGMGWGQELVNAIGRQYEERIAGWGEEAKRQLGADYQRTVSQCGAAINYLERTCPNIRQALQETGAGNRIEIIRAFSMLGEMLGSDPGKAAQFGGSVKTGLDALYPNTDFKKYY